MSITIDDISYVKSKVVTNTDTNGGRLGSIKVISGVRHSLFPRVTKQERTNGVLRYRKEFWKNSNSDNLPAYGLLQWLDIPSNSGDRFYIRKGTKSDSQVNLTSPGTSAVTLWTGCGMLETPITAGDDSVVFTMESNDYSFENGGYLHICNRLHVAQTIAADVKIGDSVRETTGTWSRISSTSDVSYPNGVYVGDNSVISLKDTTNEEWLKIAEKITTDESIGTGNGTTTVTLSSLTNAANGICNYPDKLPVISTKDASDADLFVYFKQDGTVDTASSNAISGKLNMVDGVWTTQIEWSTAPGTGKDILITYREKAYKYTSNVVVVDLDEQVSNSYSVGSTVVSGCVYDDIIEASIQNFVRNSISGNFDNATYPIIAEQPGAVDDTITITFTSGSGFSVVGTSLGSIGIGTISASKTFKNPETGEDMLTINNLGWSGSFAIGDSFTFEMISSSSPIWLKENVPAGTAQEPNNICIVAYYME